jgi:hypothetical protein
MLLKSAKSILECTELRSNLKHEQNISSEALSKLKTINTSASQSMEEITRDCGVKVNIDCQNI